MSVRLSILTANATFQIYDIVENYPLHHYHIHTHAHTHTHTPPPSPSHFILSLSFYMCTNVYKYIYIYVYVYAWIIYPGGSPSVWAVGCETNSLKHSSVTRMETSLHQYEPDIWLLWFKGPLLLTRINLIPSICNYTIKSVSRNYLFVP